MTKVAPAGFVQVPEEVNSCTLALPPLVASVPPDRVRPAPTVISSTAPVPAVVRPNRRDVFCVRPEVVTGPPAASVPPVVGSVSVLSLAVPGTSRVTEPPPEEFSLTGMSYTTVHVLPEGTVTTAPEATVIGPNVPAFWPAGME